MNPAAQTPAAGAASGTAALRCSGLHRYLGQGEGRVHVLKGVSFAAERGQVYAIVGPLSPTCRPRRPTW